MLIGAEGVVGDGEDDIEIANCVKFFLVNHTGCGTVSPHFTNFIIAITAAETASIY
jgi:hypothetical protein